jgi:hypothetical protein
MGKRKYNHQVDDIYVEREQRINNTPRYMLRYVVKVEQDSLRGETITFLTINIYSGGKFRLCIDCIRRTSFNNHVRKSVKLLEFVEKYKFEFLITVGYSINEMIEKAKERHSKYQKRYMIEVDPNSIQIPEV